MCGWFQSNVEFCAIFMAGPAGALGSRANKALFSERGLL
jgi:hypothetical protein